MVFISCKEWASVNSGVTALMAESLSKRTQLLKAKVLVYSVLEPAVGYLTTLHFNSEQGTHPALVWAITLRWWDKGHLHPTQGQCLFCSVLTINPDLGYVHRSTPPSKWIGAQEGNFWDIFRPLKPHLGMPVEQLLVSEGSSLPSLLAPLFHLNLLFAQSC